MPPHPSAAQPQNPQNVNIIRYCHGLMAKVRGHLIRRYRDSFPSRGSPVPGRKWHRRRKAEKKTTGAKRALMNV